MSDGRLDLEVAPLMRDIIVGAVSSQPALYSEVLLGKPNAEYCQWILKGESWGGAIEVSILSKYYAVEIDVVGKRMVCPRGVVVQSRCQRHSHCVFVSPTDTQSGRIDRFGEDMEYPKRIFLLYDGIHYDPLGKFARKGDEQGILFF